MGTKYIIYSHDDKGYFNDICIEISVMLLNKLKQGVITALNKQFKYVSAKTWFDPKK